MKTQKRNIWSRNHFVFHNNSEVGEIKIGWHSSSIRVGEQEFKAIVRGLAKRVYTLLHHNEPIGTAVTLPGYKTRIALKFGDIDYVLQRKSWVSRGFDLLVNNEPTGSVELRGLVKGTFKLPDTLSPLQGIFIVWVVLETWQTDET